MSKKKSGSNSTALYRLGGGLALISVFITGIVFLINWILELVDGSFNAGILNTISNISMLVAIVIISWAVLSTTKLPGKRAVWYILFWAFVILAFIGKISL